FTKTRPTGITLLSSSPHTMTIRASCATRIAATRLPCCFATTTVWNGWGRTCTVLGLFEKWECIMEERELAAGDALLIYTDGVTEALNVEGDQFGEERLLEAARQHCQRSVPELLEAVADQARTFSPHEQTDDITLVV